MFACYYDAIFSLYEQLASSSAAQREAAVVLLANLFDSLDQNQILGQERLLDKGVLANIVELLEDPSERVQTYAAGCFRFVFCFFVFL